MPSPTVAASLILWTIAAVAVAMPSSARTNALCGDGVMQPRQDPISLRDISKSFRITHNPAHNLKGEGDSASSIADTGNASRSSGPFEM